MNKSIETTSSFKTKDSDFAENPYGIQSWENMAQKVAPAVPLRPPSVKAYFEVLWPVSESYISRLNPVFLLDLPSLAPLSNQEYWLVRDGLLPLIWFYFKNPTPENFRSKLLVHADFEEFVPTAWRGQTELYEFFSDDAGGYETGREEEKIDIQEILLTGLIMPSVCSIGRLETELQEIAHFIKTNRGEKSPSIRACLPLRYEPTDSGMGTAFYNRFMQAVNKWLGTDIEFLEYETLQWLPASSGRWFHEFNEKWLYADSYMSTLALSRGARIIQRGNTTPAAQRKTYNKIYPIYPRVSCGIRTKYQKPFLNYLTGQWAPESQERAKIFYRAMNSSANKVYPWPEWFGAWCKDFSFVQPEGNA